MHTDKIIPLSFSALALLACNQKKEDLVKPNVIIILADDLGFGDVSAYGSTTIHTPSMDKLANEGVRFTNGYATSATSTPSRYALMTGMYPWKNENARILPGDAPLIISTDQLTLPEMMQQQGYTTGAIGKWHLGMGDGNADWNNRITPGANEIGFDYSCLIAATNDRVPTVYVENGVVVNGDPADPIFVSYEKNFEGEPTALTHPELLRMQWSHGHNQSVINGIPRIGYMKGGEKARWVDEDMADYFVEKVKTFITQHKEKPFFMYYGLHQPHVPRAPHSRFAGASGMGPRGDAILEADWCVGELISHLESMGILENTILIFSSDNGPVLNDGYKDDAVELLGDHQPSGGLRGGKYSLFDAGTHVPFFVSWKGHISPVTSGALICQMDLLATLAALLDAEVPGGLDSQNLLPAFLGESRTGRKELILEANGKLAIRLENWVLIPPYEGPQRNETGNELGNFSGFALFNLAHDPAQQYNVYEKYPEKAEEIKNIFYQETKGYYKAEVEEIPLE